MSVALKECFCLFLVMEELEISSSGRGDLFSKAPPVSAIYMYFFLVCFHWWRATANTLWATNIWPTLVTRISITTADHIKILYLFCQVIPIQSNFNFKKTPQTSTKNFTYRVYWVWHCIKRPHSKRVFVKYIEVCVILKDDDFQKLAQVKTM